MKARRLGLAGLLLSFAGVACDSAPTTEAPLELNRTSVVLGVGESQLIQAVNPSGQVNWVSGDPAIATVSSLGQVTGQSVGKTVVTASSGGQSAQATIDVTVPPIIRAAVPSVTFSVLPGALSVAPKTVLITNDGLQPLLDLALGPIEYGTGQTPGWLTASLSDTRAPTTLTVRPSPTGLTPGTYVARVPLLANSAANSPQTLVVFLHVVADPELHATPDRVTLSAPSGQDPQPVSVEIENVGAGEITGLVTSTTYVSGFGWLETELNQTVTPATLTIDARGAGLPSGKHIATVSVSSLDFTLTATARVIVELNIEPGALISLSRSSVDLSAVVGQANPGPESVGVTNSGGNVLSSLSTAVLYPAGQPSGWLSATVGSTAPTSVTLQATTGSLPIGLYTATVRVSSPVAENSPVELTVRFNVTDVDPPVLALSQSSLNFAMPRGGSNPAAQGVLATNSGSGILNGLGVSISYSSGSGWLSAVLDRSEAPALVTLSASGAGLAAGDYTATVTVSSTVPGVVSRTIAVKLSVVPGFNADIYSFFTTTYSGYGFTACTACHDGSPSPDYRTATTAYDQMVGTLLTPGDSINGVLLCKIQGLSGCGTGMPLPPAQVRQIKLWIAGGAPR